MGKEHMCLFTDQQVHSGNTSTPNEHKSGRLITVTNWAEYHSWPPIGGLRHLIFNEKSNGFDYCVVRIGRRVLIDEDRFFAWVNSHRSLPPDAKG
jgi:hypothetical protein